MRDVTARSIEKKHNRQTYEKFAEVAHNKMSNEKPSKEAERTFRRPPYYGTALYKGDVK